MNRLTPRLGLLAGLALIVLTNAVTLGLVAWNRSGEPEAVLAQPTFGGGLTLFTGDPAPGEEAARIHAALGITPKVVSMPTGGAFGAKSGLPLGVLAAAVRSDRRQQQR